MPKKPLRPCNFPMCPDFCKPGYSYCPTHDKKIKESYDENRQTAVERGYTHRWSEIRKIKLHRDPLCERCRPRTTLAALVHHKDGNSRNNADSNLQSLCVLCHAREHAKDFKPAEEFFK